MTETNTTKHILLLIVANILGIVCGAVSMMGLHFASMIVYPIPEGVDFMSQDPDNLKKLQDWFASLPAGAFILAAASHGLGCMIGAIVATLISGRRSLLPAGLIGLFFTVGGVMNLSSIPHPGWFPVVDLPLYLILSLTAGRLLLRKADEIPPAGTQP